MRLDLPYRKQIRLKGYNYSEPGAYFITICTKDRKELLSNIVGAIHESPENILTPLGEIVKSVMDSIPPRFDVEIDKYVIMPNHIHLILVVKNSNERAIRESPLRRQRSVVDKIVGYLKMNSTKQIHSFFFEEKIWQRSYHDHIIRDEKDYEKIYEYIDTNVLRWKEDCFYSN